MQIKLKDSEDIANTLKKLKKELKKEKIKNLFEYIYNNPKDKVELSSNNNKNGGTNNQWLEEIKDIVPLTYNYTDSKEVGITTAELLNIVDENLKSTNYLEKIINGTAPFDITFTDEFVEGAIKGIDKRILYKLKNGDFSYQKYIDLHGTTIEEAKEILRRFINKCRLEGIRTILIIHGRGKNSKNKVPVLKQKVIEWLSKGGLRKNVIAFCSARPCDGGTGATYVLLKKR